MVSSEKAACDFSRVILNMLKNPNRRLKIVLHAEI
jgi:hypothetical protein